MKKAAIIILLIAVVLIGGFFIFRSRSLDVQKPTQENPLPTQSLEKVTDEIYVEFTPNRARTKATLTISRLGEIKAESLEYEILYEADGLIKGINSGTAPIEIPSSGIVEREIDFGTCSSGVCRYDKNIGTITLVIRFNTSSGPKIFKQEYE